MSTAWTARRCACLAVVLAGAASMVVALGQPTEKFFWADGVSMHQIAHDLTGARMTSGDNAYRYGRILYPAVSWLLAAGQPGLFEFAFRTVNVLAIALSVLAGSTIARHYRRPPWMGAVVAASPALPLGLLAAWGDPLVVALVVSALALVLTGRELAGVAVAAAAVLTKESAAVLVAVLVVDALRRGDLRRAAVRALAVVPTLLWWTWVWARVGEVPLLASTPSRTKAFGAPVAGIADLLASDPSGDSLFTCLVVVTSVAVALIAVVKGRSLLGWLALAFAVFGLFLGAHVLTFPGDTIRVLGPTLALVLLARVCLPPSPADPRLVPPRHLDHNPVLSG